MLFQIGVSEPRKTASCSLGSPWFDFSRVNLNVGRVAPRVEEASTNPPTVPRYGTIEVNGAVRDIAHSEVFTVHILSVIAICVAWKLVMVEHPRTAQYSNSSRGGPRFRLRSPPTGESASSGGMMKR